MKIGFVVGRFQSHYLHEGYLYLINEMLKDADKFSIVISLSPVPPNRRNPFTLNERMEIISSELKFNHLDERFAGFVVIKDDRSDETWSINLDRALNRFAAEYAASAEYDGSGVDVELYGSRDSFIPYYTGHTTVHQVPPANPSVSSTESRKELLEMVSPSWYSDEKYLAGKLAAINAQYPKVFPTVDIAVMNSARTHLILGRKPGEKKWRFAGGFADPTDTCFEHSAKREASEELGSIEVDDIKYICSKLISDWRYRSDVDRIITTFFIGTYIYGHVQAGDDLEDCDWFDIEALKADPEKWIVSQHRPLFQSLVKYLETEKK